MVFKADAMQKTIKIELEAIAKKCRHAKCGGIGTFRLFRQRLEAVFLAKLI